MKMQTIRQTDETSQEPRGLAQALHWSLRPCSMPPAFARGPSNQTDPGLRELFHHLLPYLTPLWASICSSANEIMIDILPHVPLLMFMEIASLKFRAECLSRMTPLWPGQGEPPLTSKMSPAFPFLHLSFYYSSIWKSLPWQFWWRAFCPSGLFQAPSEPPSASGNPCNRHVLFLICISAKFFLLRH